MWPKVISDGTRDTIIALTNTGNQTAFAHCQYVNGLGVCRLSGQYCTLPSAESVSSPQCPDGPADVCDQFWQLQNFDVVLTKQQPTFWRVSTGRIDNPLLPADGECDIFGLTQSCPGFFMGVSPMSPGQVLPIGDQFRGELRCVQTTMDGTVWPGDDLKGEAIIETIADEGDPITSTQISEYNSINVVAVQAPFDDPSILPLNGVDPANTAYNVFNACPEAVEFTNYSPGADDLVAAKIDPDNCEVTGCPVTTEITVIPCRADFENGMPTRFLLDIRYTDEFESTLSIDLNATCWAQFTLQNLGFSNPSGSTFQRTRLNSTGVGICIGGEAQFLNQQCTSDAGCGALGVCAPATGVLAIVEEFHETDISLNPASRADAGTDAANPFSVEDGDGIGSDGFLGKRGRCRGQLGTRCTSDLDCPAGKCRVSGAPCSNTSLPPVTCGDGDFCDQCMNDEVRFQSNVIMNPPPMGP
jgi:hypothetical protein